MSGLDQILDMIESQGKQNADALIRSAEQKAEKIRLEGEAKANEEFDRQIERFRSDCDMAYRNACSSADAAARRELLACKVAYIDKAIQTAIERTADLPDSEYFGILIRLLGKHIRKGKGILQLSAKDLKRLPADFERNIHLLAESENSEIELLAEPADIENGFILSYGLISENCSFDSIAESEKNEIRDIAAAVLFEG